MSVASGHGHLTGQVRSMLLRDRQKAADDALRSKARIVEQDYGPTGDWKPKYPDFEWEHSDRTTVRPSTGGPDWTPAPASSHVDSFRFFDARKRGFGLDGKGNSRIAVRFKPNGKQFRVTEYDYFFSDHAVAEAVWNMLINAAHPGVIVQEVLIANKVPYNRRA